MAAPAVDFKAVAAQDAAKTGVLPPNIFVRQINQESGFDPTAQSSAGAEGIAQIVPRYHPGVNPMDPVAALSYAANYMATLVKKYGGLAPALSVYNSGSPTAYKDPNFAHGQTYNYVRDILGGAPTATVAPTVSPTLAAAQPKVAPAVPNGQAAINALLGIAEGGSPVGLLTSLANAPALTATSTVAPSPVTSAPVAPQTGPKLGFKLTKVPTTVTTRPGIEVNQQILPQTLSIAKTFGVKVNSGYRSPAHNAAVGGAKDSDHLTGDAVDFTGTPAQMETLHAWAVQQGFPYVEPMDQAKNHVHISFLRKGGAPA